MKLHNHSSGINKDKVCNVPEEHS